MFYPGEQIVHKSRDDFGDLIIADSEHLRSLYFGTEKRQSSMLLQHPGVLVLEYTRIIMLSFLLLNAKPRRVLVLGMGGGSIPKFLLRAFPSVKIDVVELRQSVIQLSYAYFSVPESHKSMRIINDDARNYVKEASELGYRYDVLLLDAYDEDGPSGLMTDPSFWNQCKHLMNDHAVLSVNLWNRKEDHFQKHLHRLRTHFSGDVFQYAIDKKNSNAIVFCMQHQFGVNRLAGLADRALAWQKQFGLDMPQYLSRLRRQNMSLLSRWL